MVVLGKVKLVGLFLELMVQYDSFWRKLLSITMVVVALIQINAIVQYDRFIIKVKMVGMGIFLILMVSNLHSLQVSTSSEWFFLEGAEGSCSDFEGCTDPTAVNFDSTAALDDGSCAYSCAEIGLSDASIYMSTNGTVSGWYGSSYH